MFPRKRKGGENFAMRRLRLGQEIKEAAKETETPNRKEGQAVQ